MIPRKERIKKQGLLMIQQREMHSAEKQLFTSVVSFSTTASYYSQLLTNAHPNYLIMLASIRQEPIPLFHILDKGRDCLNHLYCCLITPLPHLSPHLSILMIFYSLWSTSLLHFLPFPESRTFSSPSSTTMQHAPTLIHDWGPAQCSALNLHYFTCSSQQTYKLHVALLPGPHRRKWTWRVTCSSHRGRSVHSLTSHTTPSSEQKHCSLLRSYQRLDLSSTIHPSLRSENSQV